MEKYKAIRELCQLDCAEESVLLVLSKYKYATERKISTLNEH